MKIQGEIEERLKQKFQPNYIEIINESDQHSGPPGRESHFRLILVSSAFEGLSKVKRQQEVYRLLADFMTKPIHALSMYTYSPEEWQQKQGLAESPACAGSKKAEE